MRLRVPASESGRAWHSSATGRRAATARWPVHRSVGPMPPVRVVPLNRRPTSAAARPRLASRAGLVLCGGPTTARNTSRPSDHTCDEQSASHDLSSLIAQCNPLVLCSFPTGDRARQLSRRFADPTVARPVTSGAPPVWPAVRAPGCNRSRSTARSAPASRCRRRERSLRR